MRLAIGVVLVLAMATAGAAQTTHPTTQPSSGARDALKSVSAEQMMEQLLKPATNPARPLGPLPDSPATDKTSGRGAVKPDAPTVSTMREGTYIIDRIGRLTHTDDGKAEFTFESDGKAMKDPPLIILPNIKLSQIEDMVAATDRDLKFRVTGMVTEYRGRNYLLLEKVTAPPDVTLQF